MYPKSETEGEIECFTLILIFLNLMRNPCHKGHSVDFKIAIKSYPICRQADKFHFTRKFSQPYIYEYIEMKEESRKKKTLSDITSFQSQDERGRK